MKTTVAMLSLAIILGLVGMATPANASPTAPARTTAQVVISGTRLDGIESCGSVVGGVSGNPYALVAAAISAPFCGAWLGGLNAGSICWQSRQWWGGWARWFVRLVTWGRYSRC